MRRAGGRFLHVLTGNARPQHDRCVRTSCPHGATLELLFVAAAAPWLARTAAAAARTATATAAAAADAMWPSLSARRLARICRDAAGRLHGRAVQRFSSWHGAVETDGLQHVGVRRPASRRPRPPTHTTHAHVRWMDRGLASPCRPSRPEPLRGSKGSECLVHTRTPPSTTTTHHRTHACAHACPPALGWPSLAADLASRVAASHRVAKGWIRTSRRGSWTPSSRRRGQPS